MEHALAELPLAIFTTLAPIGAGAFIVLAIAFFTTKFTDEQMKKLDKMTLIPLILVAVGLGASVLHLSAPLNAIFVFSGLGQSPLTNEIAVAGVFFVLAAAYTILALWGKLSEGLRKILLALTSVAALIFAAFVGLAYMMDTIASWNTPYTILEIVGFCLLGGSVLGTFVLMMAGVLDDARKTPFKIVVAIMAVLGAIVALGAVGAHVMMINGMNTAMVSGAHLLEEALVVLIVFGVGALAALICELLLLFKSSSKMIGGVALALAIVAVFAGRMVFYATQISVGLQ